MLALTRGRALAEPALVRATPSTATTATTIGLLLGAIPIFTALLGVSRSDASA